CRQAVHSPGVARLSISQPPSSLALSLLSPRDPRLKHEETLWKAVLSPRRGRPCTSLGRQPQDAITAAKPPFIPPLPTPSPGIARAGGGERRVEKIKYSCIFILGLTPQASALPPAPRAFRIASKEWGAQKSGQSGKFGWILLTAAFFGVIGMKYERREL